MRSMWAVLAGWADEVIAFEALPELFFTLIFGTCWSLLKAERGDWAVEFVPLGFLEFFLKSKMTVEGLFEWCASGFTRS